MLACIWHGGIPLRLTVFLQAGLGSNLTGTPSPPTSSAYSCALIVCWITAPVAPLRSSKIIKTFFAYELLGNAYEPIPGFRSDKTTNNRSPAFSTKLIHCSASEDLCDRRQIIARNAQTSLLLLFRRLASCRADSAKLNSSS